MENINNQTSELPPFNPQSPIEINPVFPKNKLSKKIVISILLVLLIITTFIGIVLFKKTVTTKTNQTETIINKVNNKANPGWKIYRNDVLGIEFQYPKKWGELIISPSSNITNLETINKDFLNAVDNNLRYMVEVRFSQNSYITFNFINDKYPGRNYPNVFANKYGPMDNFQTLKDTKNICNYHFNFQNDVDGRSVSFIERENDCKDNIKTTLFFDNPDAMDSNNNKYFNYEISQYFYKKLNNGYFDNLLIKNFINNYQGPESNLNLNQIIAKDVMEIPYELSISDFKEFVESIKIFNPPVPTPIIFSQNTGEDKNITTIRQYYFYLATQKLSDAYEMYQNKNVSFDKFNEWYGQVFNTNIYNIQKTGTNNYTFNVDLSESNKPIAKYKVVMEVNNNKINTLSSEQITSDQIKFNNLTAFTRLKSEKNEIVLIKDGQEIIIDNGDNDWENHFNTSNSFGTLSFSPQGNYLFFVKNGWESAIARIYDIKNQKMFTFPSGIELCSAEVKFSSNEKYIFISSEPGICSDNQAKIVNLSTGFLIHDFFKDINLNQSTGEEIFSFEYLKDQNIVEFKYFIDNNQILKTEKFDLNSEKVVQ